MTPGVPTSSYSCSFLTSHFPLRYFHPWFIYKEKRNEKHLIGFIFSCSFMLPFFHAPFTLSPFLPPSVMSIVAQRLTPTPPSTPPNEWHWLGLLIELGWRSNCNGQQMAGAFLHSGSRRSLPHCSARGNVKPPREGEETERTGHP